MRRNVKRTMTVVGCMIALCAALAGICLMRIKQQNLTADVTRYEVKVAQLPAAFAGMTIAQVSDYHGDDTCAAQILDSLCREQPDLIAVTGDLLDPEVEEKSLRFAAELAKIAPVYCVAGNHEARMENYTQLEEALRETGVTVLRNETVQLVRSGETLTLAGADDPDMLTCPDYAALCAEEGCTILLSHRPELLAQYAAAGAELVLAGHAHGGQFRTPDGARGLYAPGQGFLPQYTQGVQEVGGTVMVISRGIGNRHVPPRLFNPPELVYITLQKK